MNTWIVSRSVLMSIEVIATSWDTAIEAAEQIADDQQWDCEESPWRAEPAEGEVDHAQG